MDSAEDFLERLGRMLEAGRYRRKLSLEEDSLSLRGPYPSRDS